MSKKIKVDLNFLDINKKYLYINDIEEIATLPLKVNVIPRIGECLEIDLNYDGVVPFLIRELKNINEDKLFNIVDNFLKDYSKSNLFKIVNVRYSYECKNINIDLQPKSN